MSSWKPNTFKNINVAPPLNVTFSGCVTPGFAFRKAVWATALGVFYAHTKQTYISMVANQKRHKRLLELEALKREKVTMLTQIHNQNKLIEKYRQKFPEVEGIQKVSKSGGEDFGFLSQFVTEVPEFGDFLKSLKAEN